MKCELDWLAEWAAPLPPAPELAARLTAAGLEVSCASRACWSST